MCLVLYIKVSVGLNLFIEVKMFRTKSLTSQQMKNLIERNRPSQIQKQNRNYSLRSLIADKTIKYHRHMEKLINQSNPITNTGINPAIDQMQTQQKLLLSSSGIKDRDKGNRHNANMNSSSITKYTPRMILDQISNGASISGAKPQQQIQIVQQFNEQLDQKQNENVKIPASTPIPNMNPDNHITESQLEEYQPSASYSNSQEQDQFSSIEGGANNHDGNYLQSNSLPLYPNLNRRMKGFSKNGQFQCQQSQLSSQLQNQDSVNNTITYTNLNSNSMCTQNEISSYLQASKGTQVDILKQKYCIQDFQQIPNLASNLNMLSNNLLPYPSTTCTSKVAPYQYQLQKLQPSPLPQAQNEQFLKKSSFRVSLQNHQLNNQNRELRRQIKYLQQRLETSQLIKIQKQSQSQSLRLKVKILQLKVKDYEERQRQKLENRACLLARISTSNQHGFSIQAWNRNQVQSQTQMNNQTIQNLEKDNQKLLDKNIRILAQKSQLQQSLFKITNLMKLITDQQIEEAKLQLQSIQCQANQQDTLSLTINPLVQSLSFLNSHILQTKESLIKMTKQSIQKQNKIALLKKLLDLAQQEIKGLLTKLRTARQQDLNIYRQVVMGYFVGKQILVGMEFGQQQHKEQDQDKQKGQEQYPTEQNNTDGNNDINDTFQKQNKLQIQQNSIVTNPQQQQQQQYQEQKH